MRKLSAVLSAAVLVAVMGAVAFAQENRTNQIDTEYFRDYQIAKMTCKESAAPQNAIIVIPQYYYSSNSETTVSLNNVMQGDGKGDYTVGKSRGQGAGIALAYNRKLSDTFSLTVLYEYAFMAIRGGDSNAKNALWSKDLYGNTASNRWSSHIAGAVLDVNLKEAGRLNFTLAQAWDRDNEDPDHTDHYSGGFNISVAQVFYEIDFNFCNKWTLTPYAGWRTIYADLIANDGSNPNGLADDVWIHLITGGLKLSYAAEKFGFHIRGGVNHRLTSDDLPSFGTRVVAPGVMHFAHRTNMDQTVGSYGIGVTYPARDNLTFGLSYDGFAGKSTVAHMATLVGVLAF